MVSAILVLLILAVGFVCESVWASVGFPRLPGLCIYASEGRISKCLSFAGAHDRH